MSTSTDQLKSSIRFAIEDLLRAENAESVSIPMGDRLILAGNPAELARMLGYSTVRIPLSKAGDIPAASADQAAGVVPAEPKHLTIDESREYLTGFMKQHFKDKTFHFYIGAERSNNGLAGDFAWELARALRMLAASPAVQQPAEQAAAGAESQPAALREKVRDAVADSLTSLYVCGRVWSAWGVGTMGEDDFKPADQDDDVLDNITDAVLAALPAPSPAAAPIVQPVAEPGNLDADYFSRKLTIINRDLSHYTPQEMARELVRLAKVADESGAAKEAATPAGIDKAIADAALSGQMDWEPIQRALVVPKEKPCRKDGRCQYAIDHGAEGTAHCSPKCVMPADERAEMARFESWAVKGGGFDLSKRDDGFFESEDTYNAWVGWKNRAAITSSAGEVKP